jgi:hypothetical protein
MSYQPKTGARCSCRRGVARDNCPNCEGTGWVIDFAAIRAATAYHREPIGNNPDCDGSGGSDGERHTLGQVRVLPTGGGGNAILCRRCFEHEIGFRRERNKELDKGCRFDLPTWDALKVYDGEAV